MHKCDACEKTRLGQIPKCPSPFSRERGFAQCGGLPGDEKGYIIFLMEEKMKKYCVFELMVILVMLAVGGWASSQSFAGDATKADAVETSGALVVIEGSAFSPATVSVKTGGEVVWKNKDAAPHTITADDGSFDSGSMSQGTEYRRRFDTPGTFSYSCDIHPYMTGKVEVLP